MTASRSRRRYISSVVPMTMIGKMTCISTIFIQANGPYCQIKGKCLCPGQGPKGSAMITNCISLVDIRKNREIFTKICSITTYRSKSGSMLDPSNLGKCHVRGQITPWSSGMADSLSTVDMMARNVLEICTNAVSRIKNTSGRKYRVTVFSHSIDLATQQLSFKILCSSLADGMAMTRWMTSFNTVSSQIIGMRYIEQMGRHHSPGIVTPL
jgi:hypothetical protein